MKAITSGLLEVEWIDDYGQSSYKKAVIIVYDENGKKVIPMKLDKINSVKEAI
jgi:hypothetical protein